MAEYRRLEDVRIKNTHFVWRTNFSGTVSEYNQQGYRKFNIEIPEELATEMIEEGWNVKPKARTKDSDEIMYILECRVRFDKIPPEVFMLVDGKKVKLTENNIHRLDGMQTGKVDVLLNPSYWNNCGRSGYTAYVKKMMIEVIQDDFDKDYNLNDDGDDEMPWEP